MYIESNIKNTSPLPRNPVPNCRPTFNQYIHNINPRLLKNCKYTYIYMWMNANNIDNNRISFWIYPTEITFDNISGYCWDGYVWIYNELQLVDMHSYY